jgi:hypothetical protein
VGRCVDITGEALSRSKPRWPFERSSSAIADLESKERERFASFASKAVTAGLAERPYELPSDEAS